MAKNASRGPEINTEQCARNVGGLFDLVLISSQRAREIRKHNRESEEYSKIFTTVTALQEVQAKEIGREYLLKVKSGAK
jgi:DNA-directed RNA polymerase subunit K/omega